MKKEEFQKQFDVLYRELLTELTRMSAHPVVQCQLGLREGCVAIAKNYRSINKLVEEFIR